MSAKTLGFLSAAVFSAGSVLSGGVPEATITDVRQGDDKVVTITYALANAPAVVTLDIQTNCTETGEWVSIGGEGLRHCTADSDVWKMVSGKDSYTIRWRPYRALPGLVLPSGSARAVVTAWSPEDPPDYLVADLVADAKAEGLRYYPSVDFLPGGLLENEAYRTTKLVLRKIRARNVPFAMGSYWESGRQAAEATYLATLDHDYYMGVFEVTQAQYEKATGGNPSQFKTDGAMRPVENVSYNRLRNSTDTTAHAEFNWPADPNPDSAIGQFRNHTALALDLPSDAEWEYACRAGTYSMHWGDGSPYVSSNGTADDNLDRLGRYKNNGGYKDGAFPDKTVGPEYATARVGTYDPNLWGLYDMHGNVFEWCLDFGLDIVAAKGALNIDPDDGTKTLSGQTGTYRGLRGGCFSNTANWCRSAYRNGFTPSDTWNQAAVNGFRLCCRIGLK